MDHQRCCNAVQPVLLRDELLQGVLLRPVGATIKDGRSASSKQQDEGQRDEQMLAALYRILGKNGGRAGHVRPPLEFAGAAETAGTTCTLIEFFDTVKADLHALR